jgi:hypothetical protein
MKERIIKFIGSKLSIDILMNLLFWAITKKHNLSESHIKDCDICKHYWLLGKELSAKGIIKSFLHIIY